MSFRDIVNRQIVTTAFRSGSTFDEFWINFYAAVRQVRDAYSQAMGFVAGYGRGGAGDAALLRRLGEKYGFGVDEIPDVRSSPAGRRVSSTWIRELLADGDVEAAAKLLGRPPAVWGEVVHGAKRGRELGYPTANLEPATEGLVPGDGIYAGWLIDGVAASAPGTRVRSPAAISVGDNSTFDDVHRRQVEASVLDETDLDLYGHVVEVQFVARLRGMSAFAGIEALKVQMADDVERAREIVGNPSRDCQDRMGGGQVGGRTDLDLLAHASEADRLGLRNERQALAGPAKVARAAGVNERNRDRAVGIDPVDDGSDVRERASWVVVDGIGRTPWGREP